VLSFAFDEAEKRVGEDPIPAEPVRNLLKQTPSVGDAYTLADLIDGLQLAAEGKVKP
jgi:hypothetical protein